MRTLLLAIILGFAPLLSAGEDVWQHQVEIPAPDRNGKAQKPVVFHLWLPDPAQPVRGLVLAGKTLIEPGFCRDPVIRAACAEQGLGIVFTDPAVGAVFRYDQEPCDQRLLAGLEALATAAGHAELVRVPWLTVGHSTGGIFCRNVAYWKPERVIAVIHIKSGNFQDNIPAGATTLAGVPLLAINGEFEEYGPMGGDLKLGLRSAYSLDPDDKTKHNQSQWLLVRMQLLERRRKNPDNLMSLVVHRDSGHGRWSAEMTALCAQFIRSCAVARLPASPPATGVITCRPLHAVDGWLSDGDIKGPTHPPAAYADYSGDRALAFWHPDRAMAEAIVAYHQAPWSAPDPTAGQTPAERWVPPVSLRDHMDEPR